MIGPYFDRVNSHEVMALRHQLLAGRYPAILVM